MRSDDLSNLLFNLAQMSGRHSRRVRRERKTFFFPGPGGGGGYSLKWHIHIAYIYIYILFASRSRTSMFSAYLRYSKKKSPNIHVQQKFKSQKSWSVQVCSHISGYAGVRILLIQTCAHTTNNQAASHECGRNYVL